MFFYYFFQKSLFTENYSLIAAINFATRGPLYTYIVFMKLGHHKGTKVTEPKFWKKSWGSQMGKNPFGGIFYVFCPYLCIQSLRNFIYVIYSTLSSTSRKPHVQEKSGSGFIVGARQLFLGLSSLVAIFRAFLMFFDHISASSH